MTEQHAETVRGDLRADLRRFGRWRWRVRVHWGMGPGWDATFYGRQRAERKAREFAAKLMRSAPIETIPLDFDGSSEAHDD